jgi:hypothetical protein
MKTLVSACIIILICTAMFAQTDVKSSLTDDEINDLTSKLVMKLLLNESQKSGVTKLLKTYRDELEKINEVSGETGDSDRQELMDKINSQIEALLDSRQKMKYDVLKKDWWNSVNTEEKD